MATVSAAVQKPTVDLLAPLGFTSSGVSSKAGASSPGESSSVDFSSDSIVRFQRSSSPDGSYQYAYETAEGTKVEEQGLQKVDGDQQTLAVAGSFSYNSPDGTPISLTYVADENGFQPKVSQGKQRAPFIGANWLVQTRDFATVGSCKVNEVD